MDFANGSEGERFQEDYCVDCEHFTKDKFGYHCPVFDAHFVNSGDKEGLKILDIIIPNKTKKCLMRIPVKREIKLVKDMAKSELIADIRDSLPKEYEYLKTQYEVGYNNLLETIHAILDRVEKGEGK